MKSPQNILVVTYWPLQNALISTYTLPYVRIILKKLPEGSKVWLLTLSPAVERASEKQKNLREQLKKENINVLDFGYEPFGLKMAFRLLGTLIYLIRFSRKKNIRNIHAWCTPGGAIGWIISVFTGKQLVIDSFEPHAESMVEAGTWKKGSLAFRILLWLEKKQLQKARHVICAAPGMSEYALKTYGIQRAFPLVKPACVDLEKFSTRRSLTRKAMPGISGGDIVCVYAGKFGGIYLEKETFDFFSAAAGYWGKKFKVLLLTTHSEEQIQEYCKRSGFDRRMLQRFSVPHEQVPGYMALGDFGICPVKPIPTKKYCSPIKNAEYWALGLPVVITKNISVDSDLIAQENAGYVLQALEHSEYLNAIKTVETLLADPITRDRIRALAVSHRGFEHAERVYSVIYA